MLPLAADWRERLGVPDPARIRPLEPAAGLDRDRWTTQEFGNVPLGDARLGQRLVRIASVQANDPLASFPSAAQGDRAAVKGYLRFTEQPDDAAVTPQGILAPHRARTVQRLQGVRPVAVMDREADIFELFAQQRELGGSDLLVRAQHNRCLEEGEAKLFDWIRAEPAQARGEVDVARLSARRATREQAARGAHGAGGTALAGSAAAGPGGRAAAGRGGAAAVAGACRGEGGAGRDGGAGMVAADDGGGERAGAGGGSAAMVPAALAH